ncbi:MAG TPA: hypothetical protein GXX51_11740 [Firmicutes bacterium]|nr:hypothetical protein [Bacillota bacterium]
MLVDGNSYHIWRRATAWGLTLTHLSHVYIITWVIIIWVLIALTVASPTIYAYSLGLDLDKVRADFGELTPEGSPYIFPCAAELSVICTASGWSLSTRAEGDLAAPGLPNLPIERLKWALHSEEGTPVWTPFTKSDSPVLTNQPATSTRGRAIPLDYRLDIGWQDPLTTPASGPYRVNLVYTASPGYFAISYATPNPFNPQVHGSVTIGFYVPNKMPPTPELAGLYIFNANGSEVGRVTGNLINPNTWDSFTWNGAGASGEPVPDGSYTYVISTHAGRWLASGLIIIDRTAGVNGGAGSARISGTVRDSISGTSLARARVRLYEASGRHVTQARTDERGMFAFSGLPRGNYFIEGSHEGYIPSRSREFHLEPAGDIAQDIELQPNTDIFIDATLSPEVASAGDIITLTVLIKNTGPEFLKNVIARVNPAQGLYYLTGTPSPRPDALVRLNTPSPGTSTMELPVGDLAPGEQRSLVYKFAVGLNAMEPSIVTRVSACGYSLTHKVDSIPLSVPLQITKGVVRPDGIIIGRLFYDGADHGPPLSTGGPVRNASIMLEDGSTATTDDNGVFIFHHVPPGSHVLQLRAIGTKTSKTRESILATTFPGGITLVDFALPVSPGPEPHNPPAHTKHGEHKAYGDHIPGHAPSQVKTGPELRLIGLASVEACFPSSPIETRLALNLDIFDLDISRGSRDANREGDSMGDPAAAGQGSGPSTTGCDSCISEFGSSIAEFGSSILRFGSRISIDTAKPGAGVSGDLRLKVGQGNLGLRFGELSTRGGSIMGGVGSYKLQPEPELQPEPAPGLTPNGLVLEPVPITYFTAFHGLRSTVRRRELIKGANASGPYRLKERPVIPGTEEISIEVRQRDGAKILERRSDILYSIDYARGILVFDEVIPGFDICGNPVYINASYEFRPASIDRGGISGIGLATRLGEVVSGGVMYAWGAGSCGAGRNPGDSDDISGTSRALLAGISLNPSDILSLTGQYAVTSRPAASSWGIRARLELPRLTGSVAYRATEPGFDRDDLLEGLPVDSAWFVSDFVSDTDEYVSWDYDAGMMGDGSMTDITEMASLSLMYDLTGGPSLTGYPTGGNTAWPELSLGYRMEYKVGYNEEESGETVSAGRAPAGRSMEETGRTKERTESLVATAAWNISPFELRAEAEAGSVSRIGPATRPVTGNSTANAGVSTNNNTTTDDATTISTSSSTFRALRFSLDYPGGTPTREDAPDGVSFRIKVGSRSDGTASGMHENTLELHMRRPLRPWLVASLMQRWGMRRNAFTSLTALGLEATLRSGVTAAVRYETDTQTPATGLALEPPEGPAGSLACGSQSASNSREALRVGMTAKDIFGGGIEARLEGFAARSRAPDAPALHYGAGAQGPCGSLGNPAPEEPKPEIDVSATIEHVPAGPGDFYASASLGYRFTPGLERRSFIAIGGAARPLPGFTLTGRHTTKIVKDLADRPAVGGLMVITSTSLARTDLKLSEDITLAGEYRMASQAPTQGRAENLCLETVLDRWNPFKVVIGYALLKGTSSIAPDYLRPGGFYLNISLKLSR